MLAIAEALPRILRLFPTLQSEQVSLPDALGRVLAEELTARLALPAFDNSAMDGYAVRKAEAHTGSTLGVCGEIPAGAGGSPPLPERSAYRIFTGAPMPPGADTVVMQENATREGDTVRIEEAATFEGQHVRRAGSDVSPHSTLLGRGALLGPGEVALLAAQGIATCPVVRRPRVAILSTGSELVELHDAQRPFAVVNSNAYALSALVREAGAEPMVLPAAPDDLKIIKERLSAALTADVVLCSGGVSVGDHDLVAQAFDEVGVTTDFWKVAIKPGKPLRVGTHGGVPVIGLPGNPISAMVTFELFVRPGLLQMSGHTSIFRPTVEALLERDYGRKPGRTEFARGSLLAGTPRPTIRLHATQGSGALRSMVGVDGLAILPRGRASLPAGEVVSVIVLRHGALSQPGQHPLLDADV